MNTLVIGGGMLGCAIASRLAKLGAPVTIFSNSSRVVHTGARVVRGSYAVELPHHLPSFDVIVHAAGFSGNLMCLAHARDAVEQHVLSVERVARWSRAADVRAIICSSHLVFEGYDVRHGVCTETTSRSAFTFYGSLKSTAESLVETAPNVTILRLPNLYPSYLDPKRDGVLERFLRAALVGHKPQVNVAGAVDLLHVGDVAALIDRMTRVKPKHGVYHASGQWMTLPALWALVSHVADAPESYEVVHGGSRARVQPSDFAEFDWRSGTDLSVTVRETIAQERAK